jgi:hypothetical protein
LQKQEPGQKIKKLKTVHIHTATTELKQLPEQFASRRKKIGTSDFSSPQKGRQEKNPISMLS